MGDEAKTTEAAEALKWAYQQLPFAQDGLPCAHKTQGN
jgi:hypothetical protein